MPPFCFTVLNGSERERMSFLHAGMSSCKSWCFPPPLSYITETRRAFSCKLITSFHFFLLKLNFIEHHIIKIQRTMLLMVCFSKNTTKGLFSSTRFHFMLYLSFFFGKVAFINSSSKGKKARSLYRWEDLYVALESTKRKNHTVEIRLIFVLNCMPSIRKLKILYDCFQGRLENFGIIVWTKYSSTQKTYSTTK